MATSDSTTKRCSLCKQTKPYSDFTRDKSRPDGYAYCCKVCVRNRQDPVAKREYNQRRYQEQRSERLAYAAQYREDNREKHNASSVRWYWNNRERVLQQEREHYKANPAKEKQRTRLWVLANPNKFKAQKTVHNAVRAGKLPVVATLKCARCGEQAAHYHHWSYEREHWLDVEPVCAKCHRRIHVGMLE